MTLDINYKTTNPRNVDKILDTAIRHQLSKIGNVGTRIFGGRMGDFTLNGSGNTFEVTMALAQDFDAVRIITANSYNGTNTSSPSMVANIAVVGDASDATLDAASWSTGVTWSAAGTVALQANTTALRRTYQVSDWINKASIPRTDGGFLPLLSVRCWVATNANPITILGNGSDSFSNWATHPSGRIWKMRKGNNNFASTNQATFTASATVSQQSPIIGVQYAARGAVITVMAAGDSITEGRGTYLGEGFIFPAVAALSNKEGVAIEYANIAWAGVPTSAIRDQILNILYAGIIPDMLFVPSGSPNDISTTISATDIANIRSNISRALVAMRENQVVPIVWPWLPSNPNIKAYGATDSLRVSYNNEIYKYPVRGINVALVDTLINGVVDGSNQVNMAIGTTTDDIHPNNTGNGLMSESVKEIIAKFLYI